LLVLGGKVHSRDLLNVASLKEDVWMGCLFTIKVDYLSVQEIPPLVLEHQREPIYQVTFIENTLKPYPILAGVSRSTNFYIFGYQNDETGWVIENVIGNVHSDGRE